eukprot:Sspe_Gene.99756::Locus_73580_Transcript_1_1_Confidence_1.000_Length_535::g.99756::m.99756
MGSCEGPKDQGRPEAADTQHSISQLFLPNIIFVYLYLLPNSSLPPLPQAHLPSPPSPRNGPPPSPFPTLSLSHPLRSPSPRSKSPPSYHSSPPPPKRQLSTLSSSESPMAASKGHSNVCASNSWDRADQQWDPVLYEFCTTS